MGHMGGLINPAPGADNTQPVFQIPKPRKRAPSQKKLHNKKFKFQSQRKICKMKYELIPHDRTEAETMKPEIKSLFVRTFEENYRLIAPEDLKFHFVTRACVTQWLEETFDEEWAIWEERPETVQLLIAKDTRNGKLDSKYKVIT